MELVAKLRSTDTTHNKALPQLCQYECGWDAAVMPRRYRKDEAEPPRPAADIY